MTDKRYRETERRWRESGLDTDGALFLRERLRNGDLTENQINMAAYLNYGPAVEYKSDGLYDRTGVFNDHITGICPCGWCRWEEGVSAWLKGLLNWAQNLPFKGIDDHHAEQETLIRMGRAIAAAIWEEQGRPQNNRYLDADNLACRFLEERSESVRTECRTLWNDPDWGEDWYHSLLYYIVMPSGWHRNMLYWIFEAGQRLAPPCKHCGNRVPDEMQEQLWIFNSALGEAEINCDHCHEKDHSHLAKIVIEDALAPWVISTPQR